MSTVAPAGVARTLPAVLRAAAVVTTVLVALVGSLAVQSATAPARAASCFQNGCTGLGPVATHCDDDARSEGNADIRNAYGMSSVSLMWSPTCKAFWARGLSLNGGASPYEPNYRIRIEKRRVSDNVLLYKDVATVYSDTSFYEWTLMAGDTLSSKVRACVEWDGVWKCTVYW